VISVQQQTPDKDFCHFSILNVRFAFWAFFSKTGKTRVSHRVKMMTQMTHCPGDPVTQFHVCCVCLCLSVMCRYSIELFWWIELIFGIWVSFRPASLLLHCVMRKFRYLQKQFCFQLPNYADNIVLPSFARCMLLLQQLIDISCPQSPQQRTCGSEFIVS